MNFSHYKIFSPTNQKYNMNNVSKGNAITEPWTEFVAYVSFFIIVALHGEVKGKAFSDCVLLFPNN